MKVVIITLDITLFGGTERAIHNLSEMLKEDCETTIYSISSKNTDTIFYQFSNTVKIKHLGHKNIPVSLSKKIFWFRQVVKDLKNQIKEDKPNFILGTGHNINFLLPFIKYGKSKIYGAEHIDINTIPSFSKKLMSLFYPKLNGIIVLSKMAKAKASSLNKNILVIPNIVKRENNRLLSKKTDTQNIIMVGRISKEKGFDRIIPIAKFLKEFYPFWRIQIYGDGPMRNELTNDLEQNQLNNVNLQGITKNINEKYLSSSIFMMTSYTEAMPMVILEAKSFDLPVIAFKNEGTNLLIENEINGFLASNNDDFCKYLEILIKNDNNIIQKFNLESEKQLETYSEEKIKEMWLSVIASC